MEFVINEPVSKKRKLINNDKPIPYDVLLQRYQHMTKFAQITSQSLDDLFLKIVAVTDPSLTVDMDVKAPFDRFIKNIDTCQCYYDRREEVEKYTAMEGGYKVRFCKPCVDKWDIYIEESKSKDDKKSPYSFLTKQ